MENQIILDLDTLKYIQAAFKIHSDHSCSCNGYRSLENLIKVEEKANHNLKREDIESFGFKRDIEDSLGISYILNEELNIQLFLQGKHEPLCVCPCTDCNVTLMIISRGPAEEKGTTNLFVGYIKNKSELKRVLQQLGII